ncbi:MAG: hypothetical protein QOE40_1847 [Actinomycetota bacterium]|jgi:uncharacterized membrane protein YcaP (DUF421 family)|nr:hypothetical protein [Actinomycetota bacterium]
MEIVLRAVVMFGFLWLVTRAVGKRELGQLSAFELVLLVSMGDLVQQSVTQEDYSVTGGVLTVGTFALLSVGLSYLSWRFPRSRKVLEGRPAVLMRDGEPAEDVLAHERLTMTELQEAARKNGIRDLGDVELAVLENDGSISFFKAAS